jgi:hypothetical protein
MRIEREKMKKNLSNKRDLTLPTLKPQRRKLRLNEKNSRKTAYGYSRAFSGEYHNLHSCAKSADGSKSAIF